MIRCLALVSALLGARSLPCTAGEEERSSVQTASVKGLLLSHESKPLLCDAGLWTAVPGHDGSDAWAPSGFVSTSSDGAFRLQDVRAGRCVLIARYDAADSQNLIVHRFTLAPAQEKDLGALRPVGDEHHYRLGFVDREGRDVTETVSPLEDQASAGTAGPRFGVQQRVDAMTRIDLATGKGDPPMRWTIYRPRGVMITLRGLDALGSPLELQPRLEESKLLLSTVQIASDIRPIVPIGSGIADPVRIDLVVAPTRPVAFEVRFPEDVQAIIARRNARIRAENFEPADPSEVLLPWPVQLAVLDRAGNIRFQTESILDPSLRTFEFSMAPGPLEVFGWFFDTSAQDSAHLGGFAHQRFVLEAGEGVAAVQIELKRGVSVTGRALLPDPRPGARPVRRLGATFAGLVPRRTLSPLLFEEQASIFVELGDDGTFALRDLPPGEDFVLGRIESGFAGSRPFRVPSVDSSAGDVVIDRPRREGLLRTSTVRRFTDAA